MVGQLFAGLRPLKGATVRIQVARLMERETVTDDSGNFRLSDVPEGSYRVEMVPQPSTPGCNFDFTRSDFDLRTISDCPPDTVDGVYDLAKLRPCRDGGELR